MTRPAFPRSAAAVALFLVGCGAAEVKPGGDVTTALTQPPADAPVLAVMGLTTSSADAKSDAAAATEMIRAELIRAGRWRIIDREHMDQLLQGRAFALAGATNEAQAVDFGKLLNAQLMGVGTYGALMGSNVVTFRIVDVETGLAKYAGTAEGNNADALKISVHKMIREFADSK